MHDTTAVAVKQKAVIPFSPDTLTEAIRGQIRLAIERIAQEELAAYLGAGPYARIAGRRGYRHGSKLRRLATSMGKVEFPMPRARIQNAEGTIEWQSSLVPRYARRAREVDAALLGLYFGGVNTRKVKQAIRPLLREAPLSRSSISRLVVRLKEYFEGWRGRDLSEDDVRYLYLDALYVRVRCAGRRSSLPVMAAVGVLSTGEKVLLDLRVMGSESAAAWGGFAAGLAERGLKRPELVITDGNKGLARELEKLWPGVPRQRCVIHKQWNLTGHAPKRLHEAVKADYHAIVYAEDLASARSARSAFIRKWKRLHEPVARSLEEAGEELLTFMRLPKAQWKALRTTNIIERLNGAFRQRIKTQGMFPSESSVLILLFGVVASGMIRMRRIGGYEGHAGSADPRSCRSQRRDRRMR